MGKDRAAGRVGKTLQLSSAGQSNGFQVVARGREAKRARGGGKPRRAGPGGVGRRARGRSEPR